MSPAHYQKSKKKEEKTNMTTKEHTFQPIIYQ